MKVWKHLITDLINFHELDEELNRLEKSGASIRQIIPISGFTQNRPCFYEYNIVYTVEED